MTAPDLVVFVERIPHPTLNPNARNHPLEGHRDRRTMSPAQHRAALREAARLGVKNITNRRPWKPPPGRIGLELHVFWPHRHRGRSLPDDDNLIASCKPLIDGLADGLEINDRRFKFLGIEQGFALDNLGYVVATFTEWKG